ncbi:MAG: translocation/assembly module TamB domain-containing protein [Pseudomonadota bacterium]
MASTPLTLSLSGEAAPAQGEADLTFTAEAPRLGPLARAYDVPASAALRWEGRASGPFDALALVGTANLTGLAWDGEALGDVEASHDLTVGPAPGGRLALRALGPAFGEATAALDGRLDGEVARLTTLEVDALGARLTGSGDVDLAAPGAEGVFELSAPDLATLSALTDRLDLPPLSGAVEARIEARREAGRQDATAELSLTGVEALGGRAASAEATARLRDVLGAPHGELRLDAREAGYDGYVVGQLGLAASAPAPAAEGGPLDVDLRVALQDIALKDAGGIGAVVAEASARDALGEPSVEITAGLSRLAAAGAATVGRIDLTASAAGLRGETPSGEVEATLTGVSAGGAAIPSAELAASLSEAGRLQAQASAPEAAGDGLSLRDARLTVEAEEALSDAREIDAALSVARLDAGPARRLSLQASLAGTLDALTLGVEGAGRLRLPEQEPQRLRLSLEAQADVAGDGGPRGQVARLVASAGPLRARLAEPLRFAPVEGGVGLQGLDLRFPGGRVQGEAGVLTGGFSADLRAVLSDPRSLHEALEPLGAGLPLSTGRITATVQADTRPAFARGALSLRARDLRLDGAESDPGALSVDADGAWDGRRLRVDARADGEFGQPLTVVAGLPVAAQPGGVPALNADGALDGSVSWQGRIERLWDYVPAADHLLTGDARIALDLGGTPASPRLGGDVALSDGRYQFLETGTILTDLTARSSLQPNGAFAVDATALDGAEGRVEARVALAPGGVLDARVTADDAVLVRREDVVARLSADIAAQGDGDALAVTGRVDLGRVEVRLVEALPPAIADLGDVRFKGEPEPEPEASAGGDVTLDLTISAPGGIFVRGRGLDSEWEAALTVDGTAAAPRVIGAVERVRGRLDFLGRDFVLVTGRIGFSGEQPIDPSLDVSLEHERDGFTGKIQAKGTASAPEIGFASTPAVPEGEVLPRTIFGEDSQSLSPVDALLLANAVRTLLSGGEGVTGDVRSAVGLDVLRIDESDAGGAQVTAGRNVADGVYVGVNQPLGGEAASVEVEVEVFDLDELGVGVVGAETGSDSGSTLGAGWRIDF